MPNADEPPRCCFDEWAAHSARRARTHETAARITGRLLDALVDAGLDGRTILDAGCGSGDLALAALAHGASSAVGVDLGAGAIAEARTLAQERELASRARFENGDAATASLARADVVVLNRVLCCYPDTEALLGNTLAAAGAVYAYTAPVDRGSLGALNRLVTAVGNRWYRLRVKRFGPFRAFVHDLDTVDARIRAHGFRAARRERRGMWTLAVFVRA